MHQVNYGELLGNYEGDFKKIKKLRDVMHVRSTRKREKKYWSIVEAKKKKEDR